MSFEVETEGYSGPIGLLLSLISAQRVDLWQLSISDLVDSYLAELERMRELDLEIATEFVVVASTLLELKCRRLFPNRDLSDDDDDYAFFEERDLLIARLLEVKTYRDASRFIAERISSASDIVPHVGTLEEPYASLMPDLLFGATPDHLLRSLERLTFSSQDEEVNISHLPQHSISITDSARTVVRRLIEQKKCTFSELMTETETRIELVIGFLAILELYRQSRILIDQVDSNGEIVIEWDAEEFSADQLEQFLDESGFRLNG